MVKKQVRERGTHTQAPEILIVYMKSNLTYFFFEDDVSGFFKFPIFPFTISFRDFEAGVLKID